ncbi:MAG: hypothetical protein ACMUEM_01605 [Flavobacteriales bacterium AspAUS03]
MIKKNSRVCIIVGHSRSNTKTIVNFTTKEVTHIIVFSKFEELLSSESQQTTKIILIPCQLEDLQKQSIDKDGGELKKGFTKDLIKQIILSRNILIKNGLTVYDKNVGTLNIGLKFIMEGNFKINAQLNPINRKIYYTMLSLKNTILF